MRIRKGGEGTLKKEVNPAVVIAVIVIVVLIVGVLLWRSTGVTKKEGVKPGEMMGKYMPEEVKQKMQKLAPGALGGGEAGKTPAPGAAGGG